VVGVKVIGPMKKDKEGAPEEIPVKIPHERTKGECYKENSLCRQGSNSVARESTLSLGIKVKRD
jgi:hypothetical protein